MAAPERKPWAEARSRAARCALGRPVDPEALPDIPEGANPRLVTSHVLKVGISLTPWIEESVNIACHNLRFPREHVDVYVAASTESNAFSSFHEGRCLVVLNSALVEALGPSELSFVLGHELGHFLLPELSMCANNTIEGAIASRRAELTMDRIGLIASRDLNTACLAKLKMLSGLTRKHLKLDVVAIIEQWRSSLVAGVHESMLGATHPPPGLRVQALVRFQGTRFYREMTGQSGGEDLAEVNQVTIAELSRYVDDRATKAIWAALRGLSGSIAGLAAAEGQPIKKASLGGENFDVPEELLREHIAEILSRPDSAERQSVSRTDLKEALALAYQVAPVATNRHLSSICEKEPWIRGFLHDFGAQTRARD